MVFFVLGMTNCDDSIDLEPPKKMTRSAVSRKTASDQHVECKVEDSDLANSVCPSFTYGLRTRRVRDANGSNAGPIADGSAKSWDWSTPKPRKRKVPMCSVPAEQLGVLDESKLPPGSSIMTCFDHVFDEEFFRLVKRETNRYAEQCNATFPTTGQVTLAEVYKFFAMILHMFLVSKSSIDEYFSENPMLSCSFPKQLKLSEDLFQFIYTNLHLRDNSKNIKPGKPGHNPLYEIRLFVEKLIAKFRAYSPGARLTISDALSPFRGKDIFGVCAKSESNQQSIKIECLCDSTTGIIYDMEICIGFTHSIMALVERLTEKVRGKNFRVYMGERYSTPELFRKLLTQRIRCVGAISSYRKHLPPSWKKNRFVKGQLDVQQCGEILATKLAGFRDECVLSTLHDDVLVDDPVGRPGSNVGDGTKNMKPEAVVEYNEYKGGLHRLNPSAAIYQLSDKTIEWWKKLFFQLFQLGIFHAHKFYTISNNSDMPLRQFMIEVGMSLEKRSGTVIKEEKFTPAQVPQSVATIPLGCTDHFPVKIPPTLKNKTVPRRCDNCKPARKESSYLCEACQIPLCVLCFGPYHRKQPVKSACWNSTGHFPVKIPPTLKRECPARRCVNCKPTRKETTYMCEACQVPLCILCFRPYHVPDQA